MLLQKVKADNAEIAEAERQIVELQEAVRSGRSKLSSLETDLVEANDPKKQKCDADTAACPRQHRRLRLIRRLHRHARHLHLHWLPLRLHGLPLALPPPPCNRYQELFQKDKEMSELIDTFDATKAKEEAAISKAQQDIVRLLQAISRKTEHLQARRPAAAPPPSGPGRIGCPHPHGHHRHLFLRCRRRHRLSRPSAAAERVGDELGQVQRDEVRP